MCPLQHENYRPFSTGGSFLQILSKRNVCANHGPEIINVSFAANTAELMPKFEKRQRLP
jgi:hypothetical protein